jgi:purine-nucleoside phosphorylase
MLNQHCKQYNSLSPWVATVKAAKAFFKNMDEMEKRVKVKKPKANDSESQQFYAVAFEILDKYLDLVELPPIDSGHYDQEFDTLVGETARIT